jgi:hypothetical protein
MAYYAASHRLVGYPSGQRGQTVNLLAMPSMVRIHHLPPPQFHGKNRNKCQFPRLFYDFRHFGHFACLRFPSFGFFPKSWFEKHTESIQSSTPVSARKSRPSPFLARRLPTWPERLTIGMCPHPVMRARPSAGFGLLPALSPSAATFGVLARRHRLPATFRV